MDGIASMGPTRETACVISSILLLLSSSLESLPAMVLYLSGASAKVFGGCVERLKVEEARTQLVGCADIATLAIGVTVLAMSRRLGMTGNEVFLMLELVAVISMLDFPPFAIHSAAVV